MRPCTHFFIMLCIKPANFPTCKECPAVCIKVRVSKCMWLVVDLYILDVIDYCTVTLCAIWQTAMLQFKINFIALPPHWIVN